MPRQPERISRVRKIRKISHVSSSRSDRALGRRRQQKSRQSYRGVHRSARGARKGSVLKSLFGFLLAVLASAAIIVVFIVYWLIPRLILEVNQPQLVLVVPKTISENDQTARLLLIRLDPDGKHAIFQLKGENSVNVGQYGSYKLAMVYPLLQLDGQPNQYVVSVFSQLLELPLDKVLALDPVTESNNWDDQLLSQLKRQPTEMLWWQLVYILKTAPNVENPEVSTDTIAEITKTWPVLDSEQTSECPIAVSNGAGVSGLATYTSNLIERAGGLVIRVTTGYEPQKTTSIVVDSTVPGCQTVAETISRFFPSVQMTIDTQNLTAEYRAKILVLLGQDMDSFTPEELSE